MFSLDWKEITSFHGKDHACMNEWKCTLMNIVLEIGIEDQLAQGTYIEPELGTSKFGYPQGPIILLALYGDGPCQTKKIIGLTNPSY